MELNAIVALLNTGNTQAAYDQAHATLTTCTVARLAEVNRHEDLMCHAYGKGKARMISDLLGGIRRDMDSLAIARTR